MGTVTGIEWADHTFNPWTGCQAVSPACDHCYAEALEKRFGHADRWGPHGVRQRTSAANWRQPLKWNRDALASGQRRRVFCASLADIFDNSVPAQWRADLWDLISLCRGLDWLLLTKRPQNIAGMLPNHPFYQPWPWPHVWLGTTCENQVEADRRIPHLVDVPAAIRFLSCEPLLGPIDMTPEADELYQRLSEWYGPTCFDPTGSQPRLLRMQGWFPRIQWIIAGGESGLNARPSHPKWFRDLRNQCAVANVHFFFKQWGEYDVHGLSVGKKRAGRLLDGEEHTAFPASR